MLIREAMQVFWQTLKDTWEELYQIGLSNLVWLFSWALPLGLSASTGNNVIIIVGTALSLLIFPITTAGMYYVTNKVGYGHTFHFYDFIDGIKLHWWRSLLWGLGNILFLALIAINFWFYPTTFDGNWVVLVSGFWIAVGVFWIGMQVYFWPILLTMDNPRIFLAWRNCAFLIFANPFYAFFIFSFALVLLVLSVGLTLPLIFVGMGLQGLLANNAVLTIYHHLGVIEDPRPPIEGGGAPRSFYNPFRREGDE